MFDDIPIINEVKGGFYKEIYHNGLLVKKEFVKENMSDFFPTENYEVPKSPSNYMRFEDGINRFRVLGKAILGYEYFTKDNKPVRSKDAPEEVPADMKDDGKIKHFWAFPVWNYQENRVQVLELTQKSIQNAIKALIDNPKWGDPYNYDIAVTKTGKNLDTEYNVQGEPPIGPVDKEIKDKYENLDINLSALYSNGDPFGKNKNGKAK